jgi:hypothetical protein
MTNRAKKWFDAWHEKYGRGHVVIIGFGFFVETEVNKLITTGAQLIRVDDPMLAEWVRDTWEHRTELAINPGPTRTCLCVCPYH